MKRVVVSFCVAFIALAACGLSPEQQEAANRVPNPPGTAYLVSQSVRGDGLYCEYSNGDSEIVRNVAAGCPDVR